MRITDVQLRDQYRSAVARWPFFHEVEREYALPDYLLFAVGSRETNLDPVYVQGETGDGGHGHGLFQLDDRWHVIPDGFDYDAGAQARKAAEILAANLQRWGDWISALNAYNSGSPDTFRTTGKDYGPETWERRMALAQAFGSRHMKFVSRSEWTDRPPKSTTGLNVSVVTAHWGGDSPGAISHDKCAGVLRGWQNQHMDTSQLAPKGAADIAYNMAVCQHGYVFELRGRRTRSAANGNNEGNSSSYAIVYVGGTDAPFTNEAKDAFNDAADYLGASLDWGHRDWVGTGCPGDEIYNWVHSGHPRANPKEDEMTQKERDTLKWLEDVVGRLVNGLHPDNDAYGGAEVVNQTVREAWIHVRQPHDGKAGLTLEQVREDLKKRL